MDRSTFGQLDLNNNVLTINRQVFFGAPEWDFVDPDKHPGSSCPKMYGCAFWPQAKREKSRALALGLLDNVQALSGRPLIRVRFRSLPATCCLVL